MLDKPYTQEIIEKREDKDRNKKPRTKVKKTLEIQKYLFNAPGAIIAGTLPGVPDFAFALARLALGADEESSSGTCRLEDEVVVEEDADSERVWVVSGTTNC